MNSIRFGPNSIQTILFLQSMAIELNPKAVSDIALLLWTVVTVTTLFEIKINRWTDTKQ